MEIQRKQMRRLNISKEGLQLHVEKSVKIYSYATFNYNHVVEILKIFFFGMSAERLSGT